MESRKEKHYNDQVIDLKQDGHFTKEKNDTSGDGFDGYSSNREKNENTNQFEERKVNIFEKEEATIVGKLKDMCRDFQLRNYKIDDKEIEVRNMTVNFLSQVDSFLTTVKELTSLQHLTLDFE